MKAVCVIALLLSAALLAYGAASHGDHDGPSTSVANPDLARVEQFRPQLPHHPEKLVPILVVICALFAAAIPVGIYMRSRAPEPAPEPRDDHPAHGHGHGHH